MFLISNFTEGSKNQTLPHLISVCRNLKSSRFFFSTLYRTSNFHDYKMSQLGHYETIRTLGMCIGDVVHEQNFVKMTSFTRFRMLELYFKDP